jgi:hypothetical protein
MPNLSTGKVVASPLCAKLSSFSSSFNTRPTEETVDGSERREILATDSLFWGKPHKTGGKGLSFSWPVHRYSVFHFCSYERRRKLTAPAHVIPSLSTGSRSPCFVTASPMASTTVYEISRLDLQGLETPASASITDVKPLSSYNWIEAPNANAYNRCSWQSCSLVSSRSFSTAEKRTLASFTSPRMLLAIQKVLLNRFFVCYTPHVLQSISVRLML